MRRRVKAVPAAFVIAVLVSFFGLSATAFADNPPTVTIDPPTEVKYQSAHVSGTVNPEGGPSTTYWRFEYTTNPSDPFSWNWSTASGEISGTAAEGTSPVTVEGTIQYLQPGTEYAIRLVAENGEFANRAETESPYPTFTTQAVSPAGVTISPPSEITLTSARFEGDIDTVGNDPAFNVYWFFECTPSCPGLEGSLPGDGASHHVSAEATGLTPGVEYQVTLYAYNAGGIASAGPETFTTLTGPPTLEHVGAHVSRTEAELEAKIDPQGLETTYHFEYGPTSSYGQSTSVRELSAGGTAVKVSDAIHGLTPGTSYHFKLVAENADGTTESGDRVFTTDSEETAGDSCPNAAVRREQHASYLPDCRAYELVTPADTNLGRPARVMRAADEGGAVAYLLTAGIDGATGLHVSSTVIARRTESGWASQSSDPPGYPFKEFMAVSALPYDFNPSFSKYVMETAAPLLAEEKAASSLYGVDLASNTFTRLSAPQGVEERERDGGHYQGSSRDLDRVFFNSEGQLLPGAPEYALYEASSGGLRLVSVLPDGTPSSGFAAVEPGSRSGKYSQDPQAGGVALPHAMPHAISEDGSSVFWTPFPAHPGDIYLSRDGQPTVAVTASQRSGEEGAVKRGWLVGATPSHSVAYFLSEDELTDDATHSIELYAYDTASAKLTLLTPDAAGGTGADVVNAYTSEDGSHVYFTARGKLTPEATSGSINAYVWSNGEVKFIATLGVDDGPEPSSQVVRVNRDGSQALLVTSASIDGAPNDGHRAIYAYDAASEQLSCVSCRPDGSLSEGDAELGSGLLGTTPPSLLKTRNQTDDGRVFFESTDRLVARDVNDVSDVYEWKNGHVYLLSSGRGDQPTLLADNSDNGREVFMVSPDNLVGSDSDGSYDLYSVRSGGGFPEPAPPAGCGAEDCQPASAGPPRPVRPGSAAFHRSNRKGSGGSRIRRVRRLSAADETRLASGRMAMLEVTVSGPGKVVARGKARIEGRRRLVISAAAHARRAGRVAVPIALTGRGLAELHRVGALEIRLNVRIGNAPPKGFVVTLRAARNREGGAR